MKNVYIIFAAGKGSRLMPYTDNVPKTLLHLNKNEDTALDNTLQLLAKYDQGAEVHIITGYLSSVIECHVTEKHYNLDISFHRNKNYDKTNTTGSLALVKDLLLRPNINIVTLESDLLIPERKMQNIVRMSKIKLSFSLLGSIQVDDITSIGNEWVVKRGPFKDTLHDSIDAAEQARNSKQTEKLNQYIGITILNDATKQYIYDNIDAADQRVYWDYMLIKYQEKSSKLEKIFLSLDVTGVIEFDTVDEYFEIFDCI